MRGRGGRGFLGGFKEIPWLSVTQVKTLMWTKEKKPSLWTLFVDYNESPFAPTIQLSNAFRLARQSTVVWLNVGFIYVRVYAYTYIVMYYIRHDPTKSFCSRRVIPGQIYLYCNRITKVGFT